MAITEVVLSPASKWNYDFPVSGAGSNIPVGTLMTSGATEDTNLAVAIPGLATAGAAQSGVATSAGLPLGILAENHVYSASGDALIATLNSWWNNGILGTGNTKFPNHPIELLDTGVIVRMEYSLASTVAVASAAGATITVTSFEDQFEGGWSYVNAGAGIGQLGFIISSESGSFVLASSPTVAYTSSSKLTKILPHFYMTPVFKVNTTTVPTLLDSTAAAGTGRAVCIGQYLVKPDGIPQRMDPKVYDNTQGLNSLSSITFFSHLQFLNTVFHQVA
jgi:hypothetical protein